MESKKDIKALKNYVYFKIIIESKTAGGIILAINGDDTKNQLAKHTFVVENVGEEVKTVKAGDTIIVWPNTWTKILPDVYKKMTGIEMKKDEESCGLVKEEHIMAVIA